MLLWLRGTCSIYETDAKRVEPELDGDTMDVNTVTTNKLTEEITECSPQLFFS